jgi:iron-sulfur cluster repair protein YtfE (RIC family)
MTDVTIDVTDMYAIHDALRHEFAKLPIMVKAVPEGDADRAGVVGGHVLLMLSVLHAHHDGEDELVWPLLKERSPESLGVIEELESQHAEMIVLLDRSREQAEAWIANPGIHERSGLHTTLIALERLILHHLAREEQEGIPLMATLLSQEEYAAVGEHSRATMAPEELPIALGLILDDTSAERGEAILAAMPAPAREGFEQFGRPAYAQYKARLAEF